ncbi:NAD(P)H-dependent oxidoreductase [Thalassolituus sp. LLYu03]|uniref:NAD(P)H-dependent oxidoreductase n=1 Tax=Thalassolituus sp. LLYu03 TaxID=3421656 RepID=UPI003D27224F
MARALILYAHPRHQSSYGCAELLNAVRDLPQVTVRDLYEEYPDFYIDVAAEQALLREHDIIILLFPLYWYSAPSLLKEWQDRVLDFGFAYGAMRNKEQHEADSPMALHGKLLWVVTTAGGAVNTFRPEGVNRHELDEYLRPYQQMAHLCGMHWHEPCAVYRVRKLTLPYLKQRAQEFRESLLEQLETCGHA